MTDLDARVAALMDLHENASEMRHQCGSPTYNIKAKAARIKLREAIRAELQKPALHEPVTDAEASAAVLTFMSHDGNYPSAMKSVIDKFLQGRAQAAQEFYCNKCGYFGANQTHLSCSYLGVPVTQTAKPAQEEITDAERYRKLRRWMSSNVKEGWEKVEQLGAIAAWVSWEDMDKALDGMPECNVGLCEVRASKGEKT